MSHLQYPPYDIVPLSIEDTESMIKMQARSWLDTYPNEAAGVSREWVKSHTKRWLTPENIADFEKRVEQDMTDPNKSRCVAKTKDGRIIGTIAPHRDDKVQRVGSLYVDKKYHGTGLAQRLMSEILLWSDKNRPLKLEVATYNERAKAFYRKYGFKEVEGTERLVDDMIPVITMIRKGDNQ